MIKVPEQKLTYVNIYFDTATMEEITYSMRTNFETKLSTIGGTMGLFTGFSLLSGVEIVYNVCKYFLGSSERDCPRKNIKRSISVKIFQCHT